MTSWVDPPPAQKRMGCFAKGCLTLVALVVLLAAAFVGGSYWAVRHLRDHYSAPASAPLPSNTLSSGQIEQVRSQWDAFTTASNQHRPARIELSADEVNALIASKPEWRGKGFVTIDGELGHVRLSIPIAEISWLKGRYLNAECTVRPAPSRRPEDAKISEIVLIGNRVSDQVLDYQMFGWKSIRSVIADWCHENDISLFDIAGGKVILETRGRE